MNDGRSIKQGAEEAAFDTHNKYPSSFDRVSQSADAKGM